MTVKVYTLFQLRQIAAIDLQAIAQAAKQMSDADARTYLDCIASGVQALRKASEERRS
jgi:hypothetical protein